MEHYYWLNDESKLFFERGYLQPEQTVQERVRQIAQAAEKYLYPGFAEKFEENVAKGWYSLSSPVWANFGLERGLPISCFGSYIEDTMSSILTKTAEVGMMSKTGGGTSAYFGALRGRGAPISTGGNSNGPVHFAELFETVSSVVSQSNVRRGSFAAYLPVEHPDILEFLRIRATGHALQQISFGVTITDKWMESMIAGDSRKRDVWAKIIQKRYETGYPYIMFHDNANNQAPQVYKDVGKKILASNLCSEIFLSSSADESFVCCLSSMNLLHYHAWKNTDAVQLLSHFLDAVMSEFIEKARDVPFMQHSVNFATRQRALGLGVLGWHSLLQSNMISFESMEAKLLNVEIHKHIQRESKSASAFLAKLLGEPELLRGYGLRNVTNCAVAPTTSSATLLGQVSPSIEPENSNYYVKDLSKVKFTYRNPYLIKLLKSKDRDTAEVWQSILVRGGSVQHLSFLSQHEKEVFKTFGEISQKEIVIQAASRQKFIDQGQSLNLMIPPNTPPREVSQLLIFGWESGVKGFYYQRSANPSQELARSIMNCASCEA